MGRLRGAYGSGRPRQAGAAVRQSGLRMLHSGERRTIELGRARQDHSRTGPHPTRRGVMIGAVGLAGLGGVLAGCSTAAVPYGADEAGVVPQDAPATPAASDMGHAPTAAPASKPGPRA